MDITKKKQTHRYREQTSGYQWGGGERKYWGGLGGSGRYKLLGQAQGCIVQHGEYSQYFVITVKKNKIK